MKREYTFKFIHPNLKRKIRRQYQNLSLKKKLEWKRTVANTKDDLHRECPTIFREDGTVDLLALAQRGPAE